MNNWPMLWELSLLTILGIYIISINYMMRQKKLAEVKQISSTICLMNSKPFGNHFRGNGFISQ
jgi:hypothetical protein